MKNSKVQLAVIAFIIALLSNVFALDYPIVDTGQETCYNNSSEISVPYAGSDFYGQDAQYTGNEPSYVVSGDGLTVYDNNTGLTWVRSGDTDGDGDTDAEDKLSWTEIQSYPDILNGEVFGGYSDWRVPTIKELYSLINFSGQDISGFTGDLSAVQPFIDDEVFDFAYGDEGAGERAIDSQYGSSTVYNEYTIPGVPKLFGVNFADGRIKGYDTQLRDSDKTFTLICVRGNTNYGLNDFSDIGDGTIIDSASGLMWQQGHSTSAMSWQAALDYAENLDLADHTDWRLPNAKELQSILDYTRSPGSTSSAAIDPIFVCESIMNESGMTDYPWFWTSTTHATVHGGQAAAYVCFGRASGWMQMPGESYYSHIDVHGAGAQRSDPKTGDVTDYYLGVDSEGDPVYGHGPQGDNIRIENYVRCVRDTDLLDIKEKPIAPKTLGCSVYPNPFNSKLTINFEIDVASNISLDIFDINGQFIKNIASGYHSAGSHLTHWDGTDSIGRAVESGVYLTRISCEGFTHLRKALLVK